MSLQDFEHICSRLYLLIRAILFLICPCQRWTTLLQTFALALALALFALALALALAFLDLAGSL